MNGRLVSNTGPIIALAMIGRLDILQNLFEQVLIPEAVHREILQGGSENAGLQTYQKANWIEVQSLRNPQDPLLLTVVDSGEASVIQLAQECQADYVLIDEQKGRKVARTIYELSVIGTTRVLIEAKKRGVIESVKDALFQMRDGGYWIHDDIVHFALKEAGET